MLLWVSWLSFIFFFLAALIHLGFFIFEAFLFKKPEVYKSLGYTAESMQAQRLWVLNCSVYNLCLALGVFWGLYLIFQKQIMVAGALVSFAGMTMVLAGLTLWFSAKRLRAVAALQFGPPLIGFVFLIIHVLERTGG